MTSSVAGIQLLKTKINPSKMTTIRKVKTFFFKRKLSRLLQTMNTDSGHPHQLKSVVIFCDIHSESDVRTIKSIINEFKSIDLRCYVFCNCDQKEKPAYIPSIWDCILPTDVSWYGFPDEKIINSFLEKKGDLLINFSEREITSFKALASLSFAKTKIGYTSEPEALYDVLIDAHDPHKFMKECLHCLTVIHHLTPKAEVMV